MTSPEPLDSYQQQLIEWYIAQMATLRARVATGLENLYDQAGDDFSAAAEQAFVAAVVPAMLGAQAAAAQLTGVYLGYLLGELLGRPPSPISVDLSRVTGAALRNGVEPETVYRRPMTQVRLELIASEPETTEPRPTDVDRGSATETRPTRADRRAPEPPSSEGDAEFSGDDGLRPAHLGELRPVVLGESRPAKIVGLDKLDKSRDAGRRRARLTGLTDLELATTHTAREILREEPKVTGYRRVLTGMENCGLCVVAATVLYRTKNLMPMHPGCDCAVAPVVGKQDPGRMVNNHTVGEDAIPAAVNKHGVPMFGEDQTLDLGNLLGETHDAVAEKFGKSYADARGIDYRKVITVRQHGEYGPTLTVSRHRFTKRRIESNDLSYAATEEARRRRRDRTS